MPRAPPSDEGAEESFGSDSDDGVLDAVHHLGLANDGRVSAITVLPSLIADDRNRVGVAPYVVGRLEGTFQFPLPPSYCCQPPPVCFR